MLKTLFKPPESERLLVDTSFDCGSTAVRPGKAVIQRISVENLFNTECSIEGTVRLVDEHDSALPKDTACYKHGRLTYVQFTKRLGTRRSGPKRYRDHAYEERLPITTIKKLPADVLWVKVVGVLEVKGTATQNGMLAVDPIWRDAPAAADEFTIRL